MKDKNELLVDFIVGEVGDKGYYTVTLYKNL